MEELPIEATDKMASRRVSSVQTPEAGAIVAYRTGDGELTFANGAKVTTESDTLDTLIALGDQPNIVDAEDQETTHEALDPSTQRRMGAFAAEAFQATNAEVIVAEGVEGGNRKTITYRPHPSLHVVDQRQQYVEAEHGPIERIRRFVEHRETYQADTRLAVLKELRDEYIYCKRIRQKVTMLYREYIIPSLSPEGFMLIGEPPEPAVTNDYLLKLETGMVTFFEEKDTKIVEEAVLDMLEAYYSLFYEHYCLVAKYAVYYRHDRMNYEELWHEGGTALLGLIAGYLSYKVYVADDKEGNPTEGSDAADQEPSGFIDDESTFSDTADRVIREAMERFSWFRSRKVTPQKIAERQKAIHKIREQCGEERGRELGFKEIADKLQITEREVIDALFDTRRPRKSPSLKKDTFEQSLEAFAFQEEAANLLQEDILTDREKIVISLHYGIFVEGLRGAEFMPRSSFVYPQSEGDMPEGPQDIRQLSELLGVRTNTIKAMLAVGLKACEKHLTSQGVESPDDLLP